jgi:hypothetical protein
MTILLPKTIKNFKVVFFFVEPHLWLFLSEGSVLDGYKLNHSFSIIIIIIIIII